MNASIKKIALRAARESGNILKKRRKNIKSLRYKGRLDIVTDVDLASEKHIRNIINRYFPDHDVLAEEKGGGRKEGDYVWIVDPLDGTTNYAHDFPFFCVSIAVEYKGDVILGVVYDPVRDEMFYAEKGRGAYLNNKKITVSAINKLERSLLSTGFPYDIETTLDDNIGNFINFLKKAQAVRRAGAAALDICYVACGRFDGFWEMKLNPWDTAAAMIILTEAGGKVTDFQSKKYTPYINEILATNKKIHRQMFHVLRSSKEPSS